MNCPACTSEMEHDDCFASGGTTPAVLYRCPDCQAESLGVPGLPLRQISEGVTPCMPWIARLTRTDTEAFPGPAPIFSGQAEVE